MPEPELSAHDPHQGRRIVAAGRPLDEATAVMILVHGRGAGADGILGLAQQVHDSSFAYLAPDAFERTWYPHSFLAPIEQNQPWLNSALALLSSITDNVARSGVPAERVLLVGFSQGACLSLEFAARNPRRYGGVVAFTGGLIGPEGTPRDYEGSFGGTPMFLGTSDPDPHVPLNRVLESAAVLEGMGADVTSRVYPGMGHTINEDELLHLREIMVPLSSSP